MKKTLTSRLLRKSVATLIPLFTLASPLSAAMVYWDTNGAAAGAGTTPTGAWDATNWNTNSGGEGVDPVAWTPGDIAVFSAGVDASGPYVVSIPTAQSAGGIIVEEGLVDFGTYVAPLDIGAGT